MEGKEEVVYDSISTIKELGDTTKTAYGPFGMNKIVQNHIEKLFLTSDAATMIKELDIRHPAAKMVVMAAHQQEEETRDPKLLKDLAAPTSQEIEKHNVTHAPYRN